MRGVNFCETIQHVEHSTAHTFLCPPSWLIISLPACLSFCIPLFLPACFSAYQPACFASCLPAYLLTFSAYLSTCLNSMNMFCNDSINVHIRMHIIVLLHDFIYSLTNIFPLSQIRFIEELASHKRHMGRVKSPRRMMWLRTFTTSCNLSWRYGNVGYFTLYHSLRHSSQWDKSNSIPCKQLGVIIYTTNKFKHLSYRIILTFGCFVILCRFSQSSKVCRYT